MDRAWIGRVALLIATTAAIGTGCGGSAGGTTDTSSAPVSKAEFVKLTNAACRKEKAGLPEQIAEYERRLGGRTPAPYGDMVHYVYLPTLEAEQRQLEALEAKAPPDQEEAIEEMIAAAQSAIHRAAVRGRVPSIANANRSFTRTNRYFHAYGLDACATDTGPR